MSKNLLLIIDTFYFMHRSFHAFPMELKNANGEHTNVVFGLAQTLLDTISEFSPTHIVCSWESEEIPSFRKELYGQYQINRVPMDLESEKIFSEQLPKVIELIEAFNIPRLMENGFEGDDVIGTAAARASDEADVIIATADQDMLQLVTDKIKVFRPSRPPFISKQLFDPLSVKEKYGFDPIQMIDYKALRGDPSDNIPGVKGIGEKTAKDLLSKYKDIDEIYDNLDNITSASVKSKLETDRDKAYLSRQLATIITDIPMEFDLNKCIVHDFDPVKVKDLFVYYEFNSLIKKLDKLSNIKEIKDLLNRNNDIHENNKNENQDNNNSSKRKAGKSDQNSNDLSQLDLF